MLCAEKGDGALLRTARNDAFMHMGEENMRESAAWSSIGDLLAISAFREANLHQHTTHNAPRQMMKQPKRTQMKSYER